MRLGLVIVAAGSSRRMAGQDKVWAPLGQRPVLWYSLDSLMPLADEAILVVRADRVEDAHALLADSLRPATVVQGGAERQESVARGLAALERADVVAVHDAARPLVPPGLLKHGIDLLEGCAGCIPVLPLIDTVKRVDTHGVILGTVDRAPLRAAQTPQIFRADILRSVHGRAALEGRLGTDEAGLVEAAGHRVKVYPGSPRNFKITTAFDLEIARFLAQSGDDR